MSFCMNTSQTQDSDISNPIRTVHTLYETYVYTCTAVVILAIKIVPLFLWLPWFGIGHHKPSVCKTSGLPVN